MHVNLIEPLGNAAEQTGNWSLVGSVELEGFHPDKLYQVKFKVESKVKKSKVESKVKLKVESKVK